LHRETPNRSDLDRYLPLKQAMKNGMVIIKTFFMINSLLIKFDKNSDLGINTDFGANLGNIGLGLLRIGFGRIVIVEKIPNNYDKINFREKVHSTSARIAAVALFIIAFPLTIILTGIGCIGLAFSKSHKRCVNLYNQSKAATNIQSKPATRIQKHVRGYLARKPYLPSSLYPQYHAQCKKIQVAKSGSIPKAQGGMTRVYLPPEIPSIVVKHSGRKNAIRRFEQMHKVRSILQAQGSSHLIIPKAMLCDDFLVEERLPINVDVYHDIQLYRSDPKLFDPAVRELTTLFLTINIRDLVTADYLPFAHIPGVGDRVKYDNLPLYVQEEKGQKKGKIGLIDLEDAQMSPRPDGLNTLVRIFPLHLDVITEEASRFKSIIDKASLTISAYKGKRYQEIVFSNHLKWLRQNNRASLAQTFEVSSARTEAITTIVAKELLKLNEGINDCFVRKRYIDEPQKHFLVKKPESVAKRFAKFITPLIIITIRDQLQNKQNDELQKIEINNITESQIVSLRSPIIERQNFYAVAVKWILNNKKIKFAKNGVSDREDIAEQLTYVIMQELVSGGEIFYFDPAHYTYARGLCWVRY
jgi:hypothetical protein